MDTKELKTEEEQSFFIEDRDQPIPPSNVVAYNELRSCADLFRMFKNGKLEIQPDFQREVVWKPDEKARFIDSLVKQLPIPSMCFSFDPKTQKWKVIDGLQRMTSIIALLGDTPWTISDVEDIHPLLKGKRNIDLRTGTEEEKAIYTSVEDMSIPITVIRCDYSEKSHMRYLFMIFNRLNSGGVRLNNQEIRNCIYSGEFNDMLKKFDREDSHWQQVKRRIWGPMDRFRSVEILLRALAFSERLSSYDGNIAGFLNDYMDTASKKSSVEIEGVRTSLQFMATCSLRMISALPRGKKSLTFAEGILVGLIKNLPALRSLPQAELASLLETKAIAYARLPAFLIGQRYALSSEHTVKDRLSAAIHLLSSIDATE
jgi:hypothetical protein